MRSDVPIGRQPVLAYDDSLTVAIRNQSADRRQPLPDEVEPIVAIVALHTFGCRSPASCCMLHGCRPLAVVCCMAAGR